MAWSLAYNTLLQNSPFGSKNELARAASSMSNNTSAILYALIFIATFATLVVSTLFSVAQYLENIFQWILETALDSRPPTFPLAPRPAP